MADWTSCAAASMLRSRSNCSVICVLAEHAGRGHLRHAGDLRELVSSGCATEEAMVSGLAPGSFADTWMVGKSTCGSGATGSNGKATRPTSSEPRHQQRGGDRALDEGRARCSRRRLGVRRGRLGHRGAVDADAAAGLQAVLVAGDDPLARPRAPCRPPRCRPAPRRRSSGAHLDGGVRLHHVGEQTVRSALHRARRDGEHAAGRVCASTVHGDELARPQPLARVGQHRLDADGAGGLVDLVVDQRTRCRCRARCASSRDSAVDGDRARAAAPRSAA